MRGRDWLIAVGAVGSWMAAGWFFAMDPNAYLLLGVPLTVLVHRGIGGRPLRTLWVRSADRFALDRPGIVIAAAMSALPVVLLIDGLRDRSLSPIEAGWLLCAAGGSIPLAFAIRRLDERAVRAVVGCIVVGGAVGSALMVLSYVATPRDAVPGWITGLRSLVLYLPVAFVLEEVFFRGAIDRGAPRDGAPRRSFWGSIIGIGALWGVWHLPVIGATDPAATPALVLVHVLIGAPLSYYWRQGGNLLAPAAAHAVVDAVRNGLLG